MSYCHCPCNNQNNIIENFNNTSTSNCDNKNIILGLYQEKINIINSALNTPSTNIMFKTKYNDLINKLTEYKNRMTSQLALIVKQYQSDVAAYKSRPLIQDTKTKLIQTATDTYINQVELHNNELLNNLIKFESELIILCETLINNNMQELNTYLNNNSPSLQCKYMFTVNNYFITMNNLIEQYQSNKIFIEKFTNILYSEIVIIYKRAMLVYNNNPNQELDNILRNIGYKICTYFLPSIFFIYVANNKSNLLDIDVALYKITLKDLKDLFLNLQNELFNLIQI